MLYVIHGDNALEREETLQDIIARHGESDPTGINREWLEGPVTLNSLRAVCDALPFLGDTRIVVVRDALGKGSENVHVEIAGYVPHIPPTTALIFTESENLSTRHPVLKAVRQLGGTITTCALPKTREVPNWIWKRTRERGIQIEPEAVRLLADHIGNDLRQLNQELNKIILYRGDLGPITVDDVRLMVPYILSADVIFDMVDALGQRNSRVAAAMLHRLLDAEDQHPLSILGMIVRQFRLLAQARWLLEQRQTQAEIAQRLHLHPFVAKKLREQAAYFTLEQLRAAYHALLDTDVAIKTGQLDAVTALDLLVAELPRL